MREEIRMADQKKTRGRKAASVRTPAESTPKKRRTAKAATAKTSEVKSVAVKNAENTPEIKAEAARPATAKAADVLLETVEAVKAAAVRAAQTPHRRSRPPSRLRRLPARP
jgi:hypothetical protein